MKTFILIILTLIITSCHGWENGGKNVFYDDGEYYAEQFINEKWDELCGFCPNGSHIVYDPKLVTMVSKHWRNPSSSIFFRTDDIETLDSVIILKRQQQAISTLKTFRNQSIKESNDLKKAKKLIENN